MQRYLEKHIITDLKDKIVFLSGPRQVGKTTLSKQLFPDFTYLNYDAEKDRRVLHAQEWDRQTSCVVFDELHKMRNWKQWLKGVYDTEGTAPSLLVTGSARLDVYKRGGDSLAGRYFSYRLHPITVKEAVENLDEEPVSVLERLMKVGGFPEPFLKGDPTFARRWRRTHLDAVIRQDLLDLERVRDIKSIELLIQLLRGRVGGPVSYASLANDLQTSIPTVKHWLQILENMYVIFPVRPYIRNVARSILKETKYYFYDTGAVAGDDGAKLENVVATALLRELQYTEDTTGRKAVLHYVRDKEMHEVDFVAALDERPVLMAEVKYGDDVFSPHLFRFGKRLGVPDVFQVVHKLREARERDGVRMIPAYEFLERLKLRTDING